MDKKKQKYQSPHCEVIEMESVNPFLDNLSSGVQDNSLYNYENTDVNDD